MELEVLFEFRGQQYLCSCLAENSADPYILFITLHDNALIKEFGKEIIIWTSNLHDDDDTAPAIALKQNILAAIKKILDSATPT